MHITFPILAIIVVIVAASALGLLVLGFRRAGNRQDPPVVPVAPIQVAIVEPPKSDLEIRREGLVLFGESIASCLKAAHHYGSPSVCRAISQVKQCVFEAELAVETSPHVYWGNLRKANEHLRHANSLMDIRARAMRSALTALEA